MPLRDLYVIARSWTGRPTLQHRLLDGRQDRTACGHDASRWSRHYMRERIEELACRLPGCRVEA